MNYIVFDLEFNSFYKFDEDSKRNYDLPFEIIQIGAVKLDDKFQLVSSFNRYIKPTVCKKVSPHVQQVTGIRTCDLQDATPFAKSFERFKKWIGNDYTLCTWSVSDIEVLENNCYYFGVDCIDFSRMIDVQENLCKYLSLEKLPPLEGAMLILNIPLNLPFHNALNDATYTYRVLDRLRSIINITSVDMHEYRRKQAERAELIANRAKGDPSKLDVFCPNCGKQAIKGNYQRYKAKPQFRYQNSLCPDCIIHIQQVYRIYEEDNSYYLKKTKVRPIKPTDSVQEDANLGSATTEEVS